MMLDWKSLFSGRGRIDRTTFWTVQLLLAIAQACMQAAGLLFPGGMVLVGVALFLIASGIIGVLNLTKRLHDLGRSGWWMLVPFGFAILVVSLAAAKFGRGSEGAMASEELVLLPSLLFILVVGLVKGNPGPNRFGEPSNAAAANLA